MNIISIDPSINNTGVAILYGSGLSKGERHCFTVKSEGESSAEKIQSIGNYFRNQRRLEDAKVIIEAPDSWTRAGRNISSLQKLSLASGAIMSALADMDIETVPVSKWKGSQGKISASLFRMLYPQWPAKNEHERDAAMMLEWWLAKNRIERG